MEACAVRRAAGPPSRVPGAPLSEAERYKLVFDFEKLQNVAQVAAANNVKRDTVRHWVAVYKRTGAVGRKPGSGRKRKLDDAAVDGARTLLLSGDYAGVRQVAEAMYADGGAPLVSRTTLSRRVKARGEQLGTPIHAVRGEPERVLTATTKAKRLEFAKANKGRNWGNILFTDRKKFLFKYPGAKKKASYWVEKGSRPGVHKVNNPNAVNVYAGITSSGITKLHFVAGTTGHKTTHTTLKGQPARNITKSGYKEVLEATLLPEGTKLFRNRGMSSWVLQQDNDPTHRGAGGVVQAWVHTNPGVHVQVLAGWPGNSPDLNPIENLWAWAQAEVDAAGCQNFAEFKQSVVETLQNVPQSMLARLVGSMKARIAACIAKGGDKTKY